MESGFIRAAKFLHMLHIYRIFDLPYQSQIVPLAAILADIGDRGNMRRTAPSWFSGTGTAFSVNSRLCCRNSHRARLHGDPLGCGAARSPQPSSETMFRADRLKTMRMRLSAAYKGMNALLMKDGAQDFRSGQRFDHTVFFGENVDIHHIFPQDWCKSKGIIVIINKTPLSYRTNRIIGGEGGSSISPNWKRTRLIMVCAVALFQFGEILRGRFPSNNSIGAIESGVLLMMESYTLA